MSMLPVHEKLTQFWKKICEALAVLASTPRVVRLVWEAHKSYCLILVMSNVLLGLVPLCQLWITKLLIDRVAAAIPHLTTLQPVVLFGGQLTGLSGQPLLLPPETGEIFQLIVFMAIVNLLTSLVQPTVRFVQQQLGDYLTRDIQSRIMQKVNSFSDLTLFESPKFYDLLQRAEGEASYRPLQMLTSLTEIIREAVGLCSMILVLVAFSPFLTLIIVGLSLPHLLIQFKNQWESWNVQSSEVPEVRRMRYYSYILTNKHDAKEVRMFGLGDFFLKRYREKFAEFHRRHTNMRLSHFRRNIGLSALSAVGTAGAFAFLAYSALTGSVTLGSLTLYAGAIGQIESYIFSMIWGTAMLYEGNLFVNHLFELLNVPTAPVAGVENGRPIPTICKQGIKFEHVAFSYPESDNQVLKDITFEIKPGQTFALVGENGAGKTTLVKLLARLYEPTSGHIFVDGINLNTLDATEWRARMSVVFQDFSRYHMTARENIGVGQLELAADLATVQLAAERGGAASVVQKLPSGYETTLGRHYQSEDKGAELSGGEWQKLALSRAFMRSRNGNGPGHDVADAQLLILDEPTAALDARSEHEVYARFNELTRGKTTLLISHRFSTVKMADVIILLEDGVISEQGSHRELMALKGAYSRLYNMQADRYRQEEI